MSWELLMASVKLDEASLWIKKYENQWKAEMLLKRKNRR